MKNKFSNKKRKMGSLGFVLTLLGSCIGLGNIWRFPYLLEQDGGGAFLVAFLVAIVVIGLPIFILETGIGGKYRISPINTWKKLTQRESFRSVGWLAISVLMIIIIYYSVVFAWSVTTFFHAFDYHIWEKAAAAKNTPSFAPNHPVNNLSDAGNFQWLWFVILVLVWALSLAVVWKGITGAVEKINKITIPIKLLLILVILIYCLTLSGAGSGVKTLFQMKTSSLENIKTWNDAFSQVFFSSSIAIGIIFAFAKHSKKNQEVNLTSSTIIFVNGLVALFIAVLVYSMLGWYAKINGTTIEALVSNKRSYFSTNIAGPGLLFNLIPLVLGNLNIHSDHIAGSLIGIGFFLAVLLATFTCFVASLVSISENFIISFKAYPKWLVFLLTSCPTMIFSFFLCFKNSSGIILSIDHFINTYLYIASGLFEALIFGYLIKKTTEEKVHFFKHRDQSFKSKFLYFIKSPDEANAIIDYNNRVSAFKTNKNFYIWFIRIITVPIVLFVMIYGIVNDFSGGYYIDSPKASLIIGIIIGLVFPIIQIIVYSIFCPKLNNYFQKRKNEKRFQ